MTNNRLLDQKPICALLFVIVIGFVLCLQSPASSQTFEYQAKTGLKRELEHFRSEGIDSIISSAEDFQNTTSLDNAPEAGTRYYVANSGDGSTGKSWVNAFKDLQDALGAAKSGDEIWVAKGIYTPGTNQSDSFNLVPGVEIYGGFMPGDGKLSDRDWEDNLTILSGDIDGDDVTDSNDVVTSWLNISGDNSYHVVKADGTTGTPIANNTILDGFTITAGQADGVSDPNNCGGGILCDGSELGSECKPSLENLTFSGNFADYAGGAMCNLGDTLGVSSPRLTNVIFTGNSAGSSGGAMANIGTIGGNSYPDLKNVAFYNNTALRGGAMFNNGYDGTSNPNLKDVIFSNNSAGDHGGAMYNNGSQGVSYPTMTNIIFKGNKAENNGGAMYNDGLDGESGPSLRNVLFSGNAAQNGGAMFNDSQVGGVSITGMDNATFSGNFAKVRGGGIYNFGGTGTCKIMMYNSVLWDNQDSSGVGTLAANIRNDNATTTVYNSLVQGTGGSMYWTSDTSFVNGLGNIDENPKFITPVDPGTAPTTNGNLHLKRSSPAVDAGKNFYVSTSFDLDHNKRITDGDGDLDVVVDMGAYEVPDYYPYRLYEPLIFR